jgi:hypothetical protein
MRSQPVTIRSTILAALVLAAACGTEDAPGPLEPSCDQQGRARFVNLITDPARTPVDAWLEGVPWGVNLGYTASTPSSLPAPSTAVYSLVCDGNRTIALRHTANPSVTHATLTAAIGAGQDHTVYAVGGTGASAISAFVTTDDNTAPAAGQSRVRVINMSPTAGAIDVFLTGATTDLATATPVATNLAYQSSTYVGVAAGTYRFRAVPAGTAAANRGTATTIDLANIAMAAGSARTIIAADNASGPSAPPFRAFVLLDR